MEHINKQLKEIKGYGLYVRISNCLYQLKIKNLKDLKNFSAKDLLKLSNFGYKSLYSLRKLLKKNNIKLKED